MATDDNGGNPTDLSGVTFIGRPEEGRASYHIQRAGGKTLGPFDAELIVQMIRGDKLTGDEAVSTDRQSWAPIMSVPLFADAFDRGNTQVGVKDAAVEPTAPPRLGDLGSPLQFDDSAAAPLPSQTSVGMGTGDWQSLTDDDVLTEGSFVGQDPSASLSAVPGIRKLSPEEEAQQPTSELPMPEGFTNFPLGADAPSFSLPQSDHQATMETNAPPRLGVASVPPSEVSNTLEMPGQSGATAEIPASGGSVWDAPPAGATIERSGFDNLPQSAQGLTDLPQSAGSNLPVSLGGTDLPVATDRTNLPQSSAALPTSSAGLPTSAGELPTSGGTLPISSTDLPVSAGASQFGTMAMSGLGEDLPGMLGGPNATQADGGEDLPASARGTGTSVLDSMAQTDDIWAAPGGGVPGRSGIGTQPGVPGGFDTHAMQPGALDPPVHDPYAGQASSPAPADDFGDFFPGAPEPEPAAAVPPSADDAIEPPPVDAAPKKKKSKTGGGWGLRIGLMLVLLAVLGGAAFLLTSIAKGPAPEEEDVVVAPIETRPVTVVEIPPLETLDDGAYQSFVDYVDAARTAVGDRGNPEDRASFLIGASLLYVQHPEHAELHTEMRRTFNALEDADEVSDADLVALARAAYLASVGSDEAPEAVRAAIAGPHAAWGHFYAGIYEVQTYRGIEFNEEEDDGDDEAADDGEATGFDAPTNVHEDDEAEEEVAEGDAPAEDPIDEEEAVAAPVAIEAPVLDDEAGAHFAAAVAANPALVPAHYWRGWVALELGDAEEAQGYFEAALEQNVEHVDSDIGVARALMKQARLADADARIQHVIDDFEAVSSSMQRSDTFVAAAEIAIARMQPEIAIESLLSALQANPVNPVALRELGNQFFRAGQYGRAVEYFTGASEVGDDDAEVMLGLAQAHYGLEDYDDAREILERGLEDYPRDGRFPYWLGRVYENEAEFELSRQYYRQAMQTEPTNVRPLVRLAQLAQRENMANEALRLLNEATATNEGNATMANEIGEMYLGLGETNRAVSSFRTALDIDGSHPDARINLTEYYLDSGQQQRAVEQLDVMLESGVESPRVRFLNARALHGMGEYDRAIEELLVLQEADADNPSYLFLLGRVHFDAENYSAARQQFVRAWEADPAMTESQYYIGRCDIELGGYNEAITSLTAAAHRSNSGTYHYWLGVALERAEQPAQALSEYDQAISADIAWSLENPEVFGSRGRLFYARGAMAAAYRDLRILLTLRPAHAGASWTLGRVHYEERKYQEAIDSLEYSLSLDPEQPQAHYVAGLSYLRIEPPQPETARAHFEAARDGGYGAREPELFQKLAYVYRDLNQREDAAQALESYLEFANLPYDEQREMENEVRRLRGQR